MLIIGLVGGIGSGKSFVAGLFRKLGAEWIDADQIGRQVLEDPLIRSRLVQIFGTGILDEPDRIDRKRLAKLVFGDDLESRQRLIDLETISHPEITKRIKFQLDEFRHNGVSVVVLDAPILFKSGWNVWCDRIIFVECDEVIRRHRVIARGWSIEDFKRREANQMPLDEKRQKSTDILVNNDQCFPSIETQVNELWHEFLRRQDYEGT